MDKYKVDPDRIFVTGWQNGAFMSFRLACEISDKIAGIAPFAGTIGIKNATSHDCHGAEHPEYKNQFE